MKIILFTMILLLFLPGCSRFYSKTWDDPEVPEGAYGDFFIENDSDYLFFSQCVLNNNIYNAVKMRFRNENGSWTDWEDFHETKEWYLDFENGEKTVHAEFLDLNDRVVQKSDTIVFVERLTEGRSGDHFGSAMDLSDDGTVLIVGACLHDGINNGFYDDQGIAYIYRWDGSSWRMTELSAPGGQSEDNFGYSVSVSGDGLVAAVGSYKDNGIDDGLHDDQGAVYLFTRTGDTWNYSETITASDGAAGDSFGCSVSLSGDGSTVIAGSFNSDISETDQGAAYIFKNQGSSWSQIQKLSLAGGSLNDNFGNSVDISPDSSIAAVGCMNCDNTFNDQGVVYLYNWNGSSYSPDTPLTVSDPGLNDYFGSSVSISGDNSTILAGAKGKSSGGPFMQGAAYIFKDNGGSWDEYKVTHPSGMASDYFGNSTCLSEDGEVLIVGSYQDDGSFSNQGSAHIFKWNGSGYGHAGVLRAIDSSAMARFGSSVAVSADGNTYFIGAGQAPVETKSEQGVVYIYHE
jgi:hypothetical protein